MWSDWRPQAVSHTHVMLLISQEDSRKHFVMPLVLPYYFPKILVIDTWLGFSVETDNSFSNPKSGRRCLEPFLEAGIGRRMLRETQKKLAVELVS